MIFGVDVTLTNYKGVSYRNYGLAEYEGPDAETKAMEYAHKRVSSHPNAAACILLNGDTYAWVTNATKDYAGTSRRTTEKQVVKYVGRAAPDNWV